MHHKISLSSIETVEKRRSNFGEESFKGHD